MLLAILVLTSLNILISIMALTIVNKKVPVVIAEEKDDPYSQYRNEQGLLSRKKVSEVK